jgi:Holliday junction resolvasome RuvABC endonuclease subunit
VVCRGSLLWEPGPAGLAPRAPGYVVPSGDVRDGYQPRVRTSDQYSQSRPPPFLFTRNVAPATGCNCRARQLGDDAASGPSGRVVPAPRDCGYVDLGAARVHAGGPVSWVRRVYCVVERLFACGSAGRGGGLCACSVCDPGLTRCGWAWSRARPGRPLHCVAVDVVARRRPPTSVRGCWPSSARVDADLAERTARRVAVERVFSQHKRAHGDGTRPGRGALPSCALPAPACPVALHTPSEVKAAVTGKRAAPTRPRSRRWSPGCCGCPRPRGRPDAAGRFGWPSATSVAGGAHRAHRRGGSASRLAGGAP